MLKRLRSPITGRPYPKAFFDAERVKTLMLLHELEECDVSAWTPAQLEEAGNWAVRAHLRASDNNTVRVPVKPAFMPECRPFENPFEMFVRPETTILSGSGSDEAR
jgi:hypothetical protein